MTVLDFTKRKMTFGEITQLPNYIFHELYYRNYLNNERITKENEAKARAEKQSGKKQPKPNPIDRRFNGSNTFNEDEFQEQLEELMEEGAL